ncbi:MAG: Mini-ribonuclease 3 [Clostridiales bacterium]|nr:Mini-ribonuclease 3 [Clostridiales bacterium]
MPDISSEAFPHGQLPGSLELAFVGDAVYHLYVRSRLIMSSGKVDRLNRDAANLVNAHAQSESLAKIEAMLTETEALIVRSAKNTRQTGPKHQTHRDYCRATGFEALLGYLYLTKQSERLDQILSAAVSGDAARE